MMEYAKTDTEGRTVLCKDAVSYGGMLLTYTLHIGQISSGARYELSVRCGEELYETSLGEDLHTALRIYDTLREGLVTPCSAGDVVEDLIYLSKIGGKF